jgi:preprotein translocase subunit YajC
MNTVCMWLAQSPASKPAAGGGFETLIALVLAMIVFYWWMARSQKKERQKHIDMLAALKRGDRVQTIGGIFGTVVDVRDHEVVLKVDETNNVKIRFNRGAMKEVLTVDSPAAVSDKSQS